MKADVMREILWNELQSSKAVDRLLANLAAHGFAVVPMEPTEEMIAAGWIDKEDVSPADIWCAMLAAITQETKS